VAPDPDRLIDAAPDLEAVAARNQARRQLDRILERMPENLKEAFILFELEDLSVPQIAELLAIPGGTVASRLRRARAFFQAEIALLQSSHETSQT
jgi:RNA polymerase sigma-70 factor (ECF subfamily)